MTIKPPQTVSADESEAGAALNEKTANTPLTAEGLETALTRVNRQGPCSGNRTSMLNN